jgi:hypothetical protein
VRLAGDANCLERIENGPAFYFKFACQIVDSNFAHPSLLVFPLCALASHTSLDRSGSAVMSIMAEIHQFAANSVDDCERAAHEAAVLREFGVNPLIAWGNGAMNGARSIGLATVISIVDAFV